MQSYSVPSMGASNEQLATAGELDDHSDLAILGTTLAGVLAGRDEVLERAEQFLKG